MPDVAPADMLTAKIDFSPQLIALVAEIVCVDFSAPLTVTVKPLAPEPDIGPPSHRPLRRLAGRAPPAVV
jgi:hypothetical protein